MHSSDDPTREAEVPRTPPMERRPVEAAPTSPLPGTESESETEQDVLEQRLLQEYLSEREAVCPVCQYQLHGVVGGRCPECGVPIELQVASPQRRMGAWLFGLLSVAMVGGFFTVASVITLIIALQRGLPWQSDERVMLILLWGMAVSLDVAVFRIVVRRAAFWKQSIEVQNRRAAVYAAFSIVPAVIYLIALFEM